MEMICKRKINTDVERAVQSIPKLMKKQRTNDIVLNLFQYNLYEIEKQAELSEVLEYNFKEFYKNHYVDYMFFKTNHLQEDQICFTIMSRRLVDETEMLYIRMRNKDV